MNTLFIDLASRNGTLACVTDEATLALKTVDHRVSDMELMPLFESVLADAKWAREDIGRLACITGPGGFTSLRVAAAFTNALAYALFLPATGIHLSDLKKAQCPQEDVLWLHSTKKQELFSRGFGSYADAYKEATHFQMEHFLQDLPENVPWIGELIPAHEEAVKAKGGVSIALQDLSSILPVFLSDQQYKKSIMEPWYGRKW